MLTEDFEQAQYLSSQVEQARQRAVLAASDAGASRDGAHAAEQVALEHAKDAERVVQGAEKARDDAQAAADRAEAPTDSMVATLASNPVSLTRAAVDQATGDMITTDGSTTQAAGDARWVTSSGADSVFGAIIQNTGSETALGVTKLASEAADLSRSSTAVVTTGTYAGASYKMIRVIGANNKPGLIGKRFGNDFITPPHGEGFAPTQESLGSVFKRTGADIIANAGGWVVAPESPRNGFMDGCQILDGVLYRDFNDPGYYRGRHAIGVHWDGSLHLYSADDGDTGASMVAAGVRNSFSFGPPLVKGGVAQTADTVTISGRQLMAVTAAGDLLLVTVQGATGLSGLTYQQCGTLLASLGASFAVPMDGGGSAQTLLRGRWTSPSSDTAGPRSTVDFLTIHAKIVGDVSTPPYPLEPKNGFTAHAQTPRVQLVDGALFFTGALVNETATTATVAATLPWWARPESYQRFPATTGSVQQYYDVATTGDLTLYSSATTGTSPRYLSAIRYPSKPV